MACGRGFDSPRLHQSSNPPPRPRVGGFSFGPARPSTTMPAVTRDLCWIRRIESAAAQPPAAAREPLLAGDRECGSIEPALAARLQDAGLPLARRGPGWALAGDTDASFAAIARWLHDHGLTSRWRDELLAVVDVED